MCSWEITVISDQDFLHIKLFGKLDSKNYFAIAKEVVSPFDERLHKGLLLDLRDFEIPDDLGEIFYNALRAHKAGFTQFPKWAAVRHPGGEEVDCFRELCHQNQAVNLRVFYSVEDAREWILDQE